MGFHWVTFFAQILNLFVLAWLMKRFLYQPILGVITKRQAYIEGKVKNAEQAEKAARKQQEALTQKNTRWQADRQKRLNAVFDEVADLRREQTERLRLEAEALRQKMQDDLDREATAKELEIRNLMIQNFMDLSHKVLTDLSGISPMGQSIALFQKKVMALPKPVLKNLKATVQKTNAVTIEVSDTLTPTDQTTLTRFLTDMFACHDVHIAVRPDLILGLEVVIGETVLEWNLKSYLDTFENNLNTALAGLIVKE